MRIVIDTNVLLAALPKASRYRAIITALALGKIELVVSTSILLEYQEILARKTNAVVANNFLEFLTKLPGVIRIDTPFTWGIIEIDPDDNKFIDAGLMAGADYIITYDVHFDVVKLHPFPSIGVLNPDEFLVLLATS
ncbi:putative toxin-antitoxin system toxin component, PIN family [Spirosoma endbachense]|uniref:Putative toxin-antitoxin system toxin component, PIN family n=1 Tax=Spirosoma endbachense TaxID=2666025 RepID=A0A6P1W752_9BACT|nr:putative toxin-antitoxin system toxin component, PIN family [Spirosoma endbachense]QHW00836.1 putative toxin-antitoxin system toxin component, PIN family [Spirosoma endbachense]